MKEGNPLVNIAGATLVGLFLVPSHLLLGSAILFACATWGLKYYRQHSKLSHIFRKFKLEFDSMVPELREIRRTEKSTIYRYSIPPGLTLADFEKSHDAIETFLNKEVSIKEHAKNIIIEAYEDELEQYEYEPTKGLQIGIGRGGKAVRVDFDRYPHLLVAGETGSGKSTLLRGLITSMSLQNYKLHLIDLKGGTEFGIFRNCPAVVSFARTTSDASLIISMFSDEIDNRYDLFFEKGITSIKKTKLDQQVLVIDEFAELALRDKSSMDMIKSIAARGRACGCNLIIATQRPDAKLLDGSIKANMTNVIGLKTLNDVNSRIIIDQSGLEKLRGQGHGIFKCGGELIEFQAPNLTEDEAKRLIGGIIKHDC